MNGKPVSVDADPNTPLLWVIRDVIGLTGTKYGCGAGFCGCCTVHIELIDAAIQAPSAVNEQPWLFSVVLDKALLARISAESKAHLFKTRAVGLMSHSPRFQQILNDPNFDIFYHAPALIVISAVKGGPWAVENCALAAENLMLVARSLELGACWIGFAQS